MATVLMEVRRLERVRRAAIKARANSDQRQYFIGVAQARLVVRKCFRLVEAQAKLAGIDPLAHQALIQIFGSPASSLRVKEVAERLDISPAFASSLVKVLVKKGYVNRNQDQLDQRVARVTVTKSGKALLYRIDEKVRSRVDYFNQQPSQIQREAALSILMFYVGLSLDLPDEDA